MATCSRCGKLTDSPINLCQECLGGRANPTSNRSIAAPGGVWHCRICGADNPQYSPTCSNCSSNPGARAFTGPDIGDRWINVQYEELLREPLLQNASPDTESQIALGVSNLQQDRHAEALKAFESAIGSSHRIPSAWVGKGYAEAGLFSLEQNTFQGIQYCIDKARTLIQDDELLARHYVAMLILSIETAVEQTDAGIDEASGLAWNALLARLGGTWNKGISIASTAMACVGKSNLRRGVALANSVISEIRADELHMEAQECEMLGNSIYGSAIAHAYTSVAMLHEIRSLFFLIPPHIQHHVKDAAARAKASWLRLYEMELNRVDSYIASLEVALHEPEAAEGVMAGSGHLQELNEALSMARRFGLQRHPLTVDLNNFSIALRTCMGSEQARNSHAAFKKRKGALAIVMLILIAVAMGIPMLGRDSGLDDAQKDVPNTIAALAELGAIVALGTYAAVTSKAQKAMKEHCAKLRKSIAAHRSTIENFMFEA